MDSPSEFIDNAPKASRGILNTLATEFDRLGCSSYVKTIYIGFEFNGEMVAAAYPFASHVEVAIALPEDHASELLKDATHLTWRTMPVLLSLASVEDVSASEDLLTEAFERVASGIHEVNLPNDRFKERARRPRQAQITPDTN